MKKKIKDITSWRKRGYIQTEDMMPYNSLGFEDIKEMLNAGESYKRTIAIRLLTERFYKENEDEFSSIFIDIIKNEKSLYTRLEAQRGLETGGEVTIKKLCKLINQISNNQHVKLPEKITRKKTYPIARDLPTRILSQIGMPALPYVKEVIDNEDANIVKEALDALGYILYHNSELNYDEYLMSLFNKYVDDEVVIWKLIRVMSGTKSKELKNFLLHYKTNNEIHKQEIIRTIEFIDK